jgi:hypothetical protein
MRDAHTAMKMGGSSARWFFGSIFVLELLAIPSRRTQEQWAVDCL